MVIDRDLGMRKLLEQLVALQDPPAAFVGVLGEAGSDMVMIAAVHEYGSDSRNIPERAPIRTTVDEAEQEVLDDLEAAIGKVLDGADIEQSLEVVGEKWAGRIKERIPQRLDPPNAPATIARKGSDVPLIDEGRLRNSYSYAVRRGSE